MQLNIDRHEGMSALIAKEKLPGYIYQKIHNLELSKKLGRLVKRRGYKVVQPLPGIAGFTDVKAVSEFVNRNDDRLLIAQDGTALKESVYSGGQYGNAAVIANDERTAGSTIDQAYPLVFSNELRSGAGISAAANRPFWYGYIEERKRFNDAVTITAGKYLDEQFYNDRISNLKRRIYNTGSYNSTVTGAGLTGGKYKIYIVPVLDAYQKLFPIKDTIISAYGYLEYVNVSANHTMMLQLKVPETIELDNIRLTGCYVFVARIDDASSNFEGDFYPSYYLDYVDMNNDGAHFCSVTGNVGVTTPGKVVIDSFATWMTFDPIGYHIQLGSAGNTHKVTGKALNTPGAGQVELTVDPVVPANGTQEINFMQRWFSQPSGIPLVDEYVYPIFYDKLYKKLGSEMFAYANIPVADRGLTDLRYKFSTEANGHYFIFGVNDGAFGYYSVPNSFDIMPSQNILKLKKEPTGCVSIGQDVFVFNGENCERFTILDNANSSKDDEFSDIGLVSQKALFKVNDDEVYGFDQRGPWVLRGRRHEYIGEHLKEYWEDLLTETEKSACAVGYNRLKNWVIFSFPTYSTSPYTSGLVFVLDLDAIKHGVSSAWWILKTDKPLKSFTIASDLHMLTGATSEILDWNSAIGVTQDEMVDILLSVMMLKNPVLGNRTHFNRAYLWYDSDDSIIAKITPDSGSQATLSVNGDKQAIIKYLCETLELELSTTATKNDVEISGIQIDFTPKRI